jgi:hypothetical protein
LLAPLWLVGEDFRVALTWTIDHEARLVDVTAAGSLTPADIKDYLDQIAAAGAMPYAKLFDISAVNSEFSVQELAALGKSIRQYAIDGFGPLGPLAIVASESHTHLQAALYADSAGSNRALQIFRNKEQAKAWLRGRVKSR